MTTIWPFRRAGLKLLSLGLGLLLWLIVAGGETVERSLRVPLELQRFPPGLELQGEAPAFVDLRVRGPEGTIGRMSPGDAMVALDLRNALPGRRFFQLTPDHVRVPVGVEVVQIVPATIAIMFEMSETGVVPVVPVVEGDPSAGYVVGTVTSIPERVEIIGPASAVARATGALTETISVDGARDSVTRSVAIGLADPVLRLKNPGRASVAVQVLAGSRERSMRSRPVHMRNLPPNLAAQAVPPAVDVVLRGSPDGLNAIGPDDVSARVDVTGLGVGEHTLTVQVDTPTSLAVARVEPQVVTVSISNVRN